METYTIQYCVSFAQKHIYFDRNYATYHIMEQYFWDSFNPTNVLVLLAANMV